MNPSAFFLHVPKTGGTSIDALLGDEYAPQATLRGVQVASEVAQWDLLDEPRYRYVSGHVPAGALDLSRFDLRITVLRPPRDLIASRISYSREVQEDATFILRMTAERGRYAIYKEFFAPGFDLLRFTTELRYGVAELQHVYADPCTVAQALQTLGSFDRVLDFAQIEGEMKRLVVELGLFPRSALPRMRRYRYEPDEQTAQSLVAGFDLDFFRRGAQRFQPLPPDLDSRYEAYRAAYCAEHGLKVPLRSSRVLPLNGPIGLGWFGATRSELGDWFRWANSARPTLELPLAEAGRYALALYVHQHRLRGVQAQVTLSTGGRRVAMKVSARAGVTVLACELKLPAAAWVVVQFDGDDPQAKGGEGTDMIDRVFVLGRVLVRRLAD